MEIPSKYVVRGYLRNSKEKLNNLASDINNGFSEELKELYEIGRLSSDSLINLSNKYRDYILQSGAFGIQMSYSPPTKLSPHRERSLVVGYAIEPVGLGQGWQSSGSLPYVENAALLRCHVAEFRRKKASVGVSFGGVALTQHVMERVYERNEVNRTDLPAQIEGEFYALLKAIAVAETCNLWVDYIEGETTTRITAVPYSNGIMILDTRLAFGSYSSLEFGFRLKIPSGLVEAPYINNAYILDDLGDGKRLIGDNRPVFLLCGVTYLNSLTLTGMQSDYYHAYRALLAEIGDDVLAGLSHFRFSPTLVHERHPSFSLLEHYGHRIERLSRLLRAGWLKPKSSIPVCRLLPFDWQIPSRSI